MAYAYWKNGKHNDYSVFDLFFRKNPFNGEYTIFCGLEECLRFVANYAFSKEEIEYLKTILPECEEEFFEYLSTLNCNEVQIYAVREGTMVFPHVPLLRVEGPLVICQLLETTLLTLINYPSLVATNAARYRVAAECSGKNLILLEFGLRRAQGPDGGLSASRYTYIGGMDSTSNVKSGMIFGIEVKGTHAHSFVSSYTGFNDLTLKNLLNLYTNKEENFYELVVKLKEKIPDSNFANEGELAAFIAYALSFPYDFLALIDTYHTLNSGLPNFLSVAVALLEFGYKPTGIRLDSGDLSYLSKKCRERFIEVSKIFDREEIAKFKICASGDIEETTLYSLNQQGHSIDIYGIGTNLVTCSGCPALGCVYKLVEINGHPRIKLSNNLKK